MQYLFCFVQNVASWLRMYCSVIDVVLSGVSSTLTFLASSRQDLGHFVFWEDFFLGACFSSSCARDARRRTDVSSSLRAKLTSQF